MPLHPNEISVPGSPQAATLHRSPHIPPQMLPSAAAAPLAHLDAPSASIQTPASPHRLQLSGAPPSVSSFPPASARHVLNTCPKMAQLLPPGTQGERHQ